MPLFLEMTSFITVKFKFIYLFKFAYFVEHSITYQAVNFSFLGCLDLILQRELENSPQSRTRRIKPSAFRVKVKVIFHQVKFMSSDD